MTSLTQTCDVGVDSPMCMSMTKGNLINLLTIRNGNLPYVVQNERYASSGVSVLISFAGVYIVSVNSPFLQSHLQRKPAARFFLYGDHLAKVVLSGTPLLNSCNTIERSLDPCNTIELSLTPCNTEIY